MGNLTAPSQSSIEDTIEEFSIIYNLTDFSMVDFDQEWFIISIILLILCLFGLVGNGTVIWLLGFHIERNAFTTYILNLAVADFGVLITLLVESIITIEMGNWEEINTAVLLAFFSTWGFLYTSGQLLLTTIGIDRCVAVLFPIWHRCHRPPKLSLFISVHVWVFSLMMTGSNLLLLLTGHGPVVPVAMNVLLCYPLMAIATLILFVKVRHKPRNRGRSKSLTVILLSLLFFLIFGIPVNLTTVLTYYYFLYDIDPRNFFSDDPVFDHAQKITIFKYFKIIMVFQSLSDLCIAVNSSINPVHYFLAGRQKTILRGVSKLKVSLQNFFQNMEDWREDEEAPDETQLSSF
ncbi:Mas-related G-protein coupled receptor member H [Varanus komodoensis]|uniref:mas-related G-protein coupled receptor member H-like n=1 Tax=Varanus komodoensis TaxID=61221 RepID=UPI001CF768D3|nr:mas-related G-protein coupled receptor member H-like [Varanus komodoensis]XP_044308770.1 mas-related G-protein coupled receptor member H-like [Varanus komodoensis]XP_044308775.1 mas-related G-protein coupled receptor member H-like [Varanus komodoensis]XP_044308776.1 mas-related G-protein coupled receptor member H-like [Varanus komodoensis]KAF7237386.1 Mas-related G-protein coupled receptor member H [Varanus komodoensis]